MLRNRLANKDVQGKEEDLAQWIAMGHKPHVFFVESASLV